DDGEPEFTLMRARVSACLAGAGVAAAGAAAGGELAAGAGAAGWEAGSCPAIAPARAGTRLLACGVLAGALLRTRRRGRPALLDVVDLAGEPGGASGAGVVGGGGGAVREIWPALPAGSIAVEHAEDYDAGTVIICEQSQIEPPAWYELDLATGERRLLK